MGFFIQLPSYCWLLKVVVGTWDQGQGIKQKYPDMFPVNLYWAYFYHEYRRLFNKAMNENYRIISIESKLSSLYDHSNQSVTKSNTYERPRFAQEMLFLKCMCTYFLQQQCPVFPKLLWIKLHCHLEVWQ